MADKIEKPVIATYHAIGQYRSRVLPHTGGILSDDEIGRRLTDVVRFGKVLRITANGGIVYRFNGLDVVVRDNEDALVVVTCKGQSQRMFKRLSQQKKAVEKALKKRTERWLR